MSASEPKYPTVSIGEFYTRHSESLQMSLMGDACGFERRIRERTQAQLAGGSPTKGERG